MNRRQVQFFLCDGPMLEENASWHNCTAKKLRYDSSEPLQNTGMGNPNTTQLPCQLYTDFTYETHWSPMRDITAERWGY